MGGGEGIADAQLFAYVADTRVVEFFPLSVTIDAGIPKWQTMFFQMKLVVFASVIFANGSASTHFMK